MVKKKLLVSLDGRDLSVDLLLHASELSAAPLFLRTFCPDSNWRKLQEQLGNPGRLSRTTHTGEVSEARGEVEECSVAGLQDD